MFYGYARVSTEGQSDESIEVQLDFLKRQAKKLGMPFTPFYEKASGKNIEGREELQKLLHKVKKGDVVGVYDNSRLGRNTQDSLAIARILKEKGVELQINGKIVNFNDPQDMMLLSIESSISTYFRELQISKIVEGMSIALKKGNHIFTSKLFGYDHIVKNGVKSIEINEEEAKIVRWLFETYSKGVGAATIRSELAKVGLIYKFAEITNVLKKSIYIGYYEHEGQMIKSNYYPPIISEDLWQSVQARLKGKKIRQKIRVRESVLSGIFKCERCGHSCFSVEVKNGRKIYQFVHGEYSNLQICKGIRTIIDMPILDKLVMACYFYTFSVNDNIEAFFYEERTQVLLLKDNIKDEISETLQKKKKLEGKIQKALSEFLDLDIDKRFLHAQIEEIKSQIKACDDRVQELSAEYSKQTADEEDWYILSVNLMLDNFNKINVDKVFSIAQLTINSDIYLEAKNGRWFKIAHLGSRQFKTCENAPLTMVTGIGSNVTGEFDISVTGSNNEYDVLFKWKDIENGDKEFIEYANDKGKELTSKINEYLSTY